jgi:hypothetical protein
MIAVMLSGTPAVVVDDDELDELELHAPAA